MATFQTGDQSLNNAFSALAGAMFPDPSTTMMAHYRQAATQKAAAEAAIERERMAAASAAAPAFADMLDARAGIPEGVADLPGISADIVGPPTPETSALPADAVQRQAFHQAIAPALLLRDGGASDFAQGVGRMTGLAGILSGGDEAAMRPNAMLYTGSLPSETTAITPGQVEANQAAALRQATDVARIKAAGTAASGSKTVKNWYVPGGGSGRTIDGRTDLTTGEALPATARVVSGALPGDQPDTMRGVITQYQTPEGVLGTTHDGITDAATGEPLPPQTRLFRPGQPQGPAEDIGLQNKTVGNIEDQLIAGQRARNVLTELRTLVQGDPRVVGAMGSIAGHVKGLIGQTFAWLGGSTPGQKIASDTEWVNALERAAQQEGLGVNEARFRSLMINAAVQMARQAESGGRLSDQDILRQMQRLGNVWSAGPDQIEASINTVLGDVNRDWATHKRLYDGEDIGEVTAPEAGQTDVIEWVDYAAKRGIPQ